MEELPSSAEWVPHIAAPENSQLLSAMGAETLLPRFAQLLLDQ